MPVFQPPRNTPSARVLERLGFCKEGHMRERWIVNGQKQDSAFYGLLGSDWQGNNHQICYANAKPDPNNA